MIKGIIFDLGGTLIKFESDYPTVMRAGAEAMADWFLKKKHLKLDGPALVEAFLVERQAGHQRANETQTEVLAQHALSEALKKIEAPASAGALVAEAIKVYFEPEDAAWQPFADAPATLKYLKSRGYRLGLYSNASDDLLVQRLVNRCSLRPWLSPTFSSAGWGWRKPQPAGFALIAQRWHLPPTEIVVVGDTLNADILGAQNAGMSGILVTMDEHPSNQTHRHIQPTAVAESLAALPDIVANLSHRKLA